MWPKLSNKQVENFDFYNLNREVGAGYILQNMSRQEVSPIVIAGSSEATVTEQLFATPTKCKVQKAKFLITTVPIGVDNAPTVRIKQGANVIATKTLETPAVTQVVKFTPADVEIGDEFIMQINDEDITYVATAATVKNVVDGLVAALALSGQAGVVIAENVSDQYVKVTAAVRGVAFQYAPSAANVIKADTQQLTLSTPIPNVVAVKQEVKQTLSGISAGSITITINGNPYTENFAVDAATTVTNFFTTHAANILAVEDIVLTNPGAGELLFVANTAGVPFTLVATDAGTDGTFTPSGVVANVVAVARISSVVPSSVELDDEFTVTINGTDVTFVATAATVVNVVNGLVAAINSSLEAANVTAANVSNASVSVTSDVPGTDFTIAVSTTNASPADTQTLTEEVLQENVVGEMYNVGDVIEMVIDSTKETVEGNLTIKGEVVNPAATITTAMQGRFITEFNSVV